MNSRARVEAAIAMKKPDRAPAGAWSHTYKEEWSPQLLAEITVDRARRLGWDFVKLQPRASCFAEAFGNRYRPSGHARRAPILLEQAVTGLDDWEKVKTVSASVPALADQIEAIRLVVKGLGPDVPVVQTVFSPVTVGGYLVGKDSSRVVRELRRHPEVVQPALERIAETLIEFARRSVEAGAAGIFYAHSGYASPNAMPRSVFEELVLPLDKRILGSLPADAWFNILHLCGSRIYIDVARELPVQVVSWSVHNQGNPTLTEGQKATGKAVMGGLGQHTTLVSGPAAAIDREVRAALEATGARGVIVAPGCSVRPWAQEANLKAMMEAVAA